MSLKWFFCSVSVAALAGLVSAADATVPKSADATGSSETPAQEKPAQKKSPIPDLSQAQFLDGVLAVVNDELVTVQDVYAESRFLERQQKFGYLPSEWEREEIREEFEQKAHAIRVSIANRLVNERLISAEFVRRGYQLPESVIDQRIHKAAANAAKGDLEGLRDQLKAAGLSMHDFRNRIRRRLHNDILLDHEVFKTIKISPRDVRIFLELNKEKYTPTVSVKLQVLTYSSDDDAAVSRAAELLTESLAKNKSNAEIKKIISDDLVLKKVKIAAFSSAPLDWTPVNLIDTRFRSHIVTLKKGERTPVIDLGGTLFVFTVTDVKEGEKEDESVIRNKIRSKLLYLKRKKAQRDFVRRLYGRSYIRKFYQD